MVRRSRRALLGAAAVLALSLVLSASALALTPVGSRSLALVLSSARAGARPVSLRLTFVYMMQCGSPGAGPVTIVFPAGERLPARLSRRAVLVDGRAARSVALTGRSVTIALAPPPRIICDVIGEGRLTVAFTAAADLGNPVKPGTYTLRATTGTREVGALQVSFTVRPA